MRALTAIGLCATLLAGCAQSATPSGAPSASGAPNPAATLTQLTAAATAAPSAPAPTQAGITGLTGRLLFTRAGGAFGDETVFLANIDGSDEVQIGEPRVSCCIWALADGSTMVRSGPGANDLLTPIFSAVDGSRERRFPLPDGLQLGSGPISPDGMRIVLEGFTAPEFDGDATYIADIDGSNIKVLTKRHFIPGDFSPDGKSVLLFTGPPGDDGPPPPGNLWLIEADGSNLRQLTPDDRLVQCCFGFHWSPDGSKILFAAPEGGLWTINPDGSGLVEIFHLANAFAITPSWSPDASMIVFGLDPTSNPFAHPQNGLYVIRADGSDLTQVIGGPDFKRQPIWLQAR